MLKLLPWEDLIFKVNCLTQTLAVKTLEKPEKLKGESLLNYHRDRYPARVKLLENARDSDAAVQLVQPGRPPSAYPAGLLSPVIQMNTVDANTRDAISHVCTGTPSDLQRRITTVRSMLGQPFVPVALGRKNA